MLKIVQILSMDTWGWLLQMYIKCFQIYKFTYNLLWSDTFENMSTIILTQKL